MKQKKQHIEKSKCFFAAQNIKDTMVHELTHKKHWDSAKAFYKANKKAL